MGLTAELTPRPRATAAVGAVAAASGLTLGFALFGQIILDYLPVSLRSLSIAGGLVLLIVVLLLLGARLAKLGPLPLVHFLTRVFGLLLPAIAGQLTRRWRPAPHPGRLLVTTAVGLPSPPRGMSPAMTVARFQDFPLADRTRSWDGDAAERRVRRWAGAEEKPNARYRSAHVWYDADKKDQYRAYKLLIADVVGEEFKAVPRAVMAAGAVMLGSRGGIDLPEKDIPRVKSHLARYYRKMGDQPPWERD